LSVFLTKEGFLRGYFFQNAKNNLKVNIFIIQKYTSLDLSCIHFIKKKNSFFDKIKSLRKKKLKKFCNGFGLSLFFSVNGFISNENLFWFQLGGKKNFELI
jgi:ribosomal protein S8